MGHSTLLSFLAVNVSLSVHSGFHFAIIEQLIRNTFNGYDCLNVYCGPTECRESSHINYTPIIQRTQAQNFKVFVLSSLTNSDQYCGYVFACNTESSRLRGVVFDQITRILFLQLSANGDDACFLKSPEFRQFSKEKDIVFASLLRKSTGASFNLHIKSRYDLETHFINGTDANISRPFFYSKNDRPNDIRPAADKRPIKVTTFNCPIYNTLSEDDELIDGVETRIYREIERKLNFTTELIIPKDGKRWGTAYPNGTISGGMTKILHDRRADLGFCSIWIEDTKIFSMKLSTYWDVVCLAFLVPKPKRLPTRWYNVFTPLPKSIWVMVAVAVIITWTACSVLNFLETRLLFEVQGGSFDEVSELLILAGMLLHAKNPEFDHDMRVNRFVYLCWSIFALVVTSLYSSSLISHLTYPNFETVLTIEDFVKHGYYWGTPYELLMSAVFNMDNPWHKTFANSFVYEKSHEDRLKHLSKGKYIILVHRIGYRHFMEVYNIPVKILRELRTTRTCSVVYFYLSFAYSKTFPLADQVDSIIMRLVESGITKYWLNRVFEPKYPLTTFARVYELKASRVDSGVTRPLRLDNLKGAFVIWLMGILLALMTLAGEILISHRWLRALMRDKKRTDTGTTNIFLERRVDALKRVYNKWAKMKLK